MPGSLVVFTRGDADEVAKDAGDEVRRAGEDESDGVVEAEGADDGWEEVVEAACRLGLLSE